MSVLIITIWGDIHAHAVRWALGRLGHECRRWIPQTLDSVPACARFSNGEVAAELSGPDGTIDGRDVDAVWLRRIRLPEIPATLAPGDQVVARRETESFLRGVSYAFGPDVFWANDPGAQRVAVQKAAQLAAARSVGLSIPKTVMTNDADVARSFLRASPNGIIYKGFLPAVWTGEQRDLVLQTVAVEESDLSDPEALRLSPGIFQELVPKAYELRVTIFGRTCIAAKISEQHEIDWRRTHAMNISPHELPPDVEAKLAAFMDRMGLVMGTLDMIVTPEGEHVFLEINEQGQFLWVEEQNPDIRLLDPFARFLAARDPRFRWRPEDSAGIDFKDYLASSAATELQEMEMHKISGGALVVGDGAVK